MVRLNIGIKRRALSLRQAVITEGLAGRAVKLKLQKRNPAKQRRKELRNWALPVKKRGTQRRASGASVLHLGRVCCCQPPGQPPDAPGERPGRWRGAREGLERQAEELGLYRLSSGILRTLVLNKSGSE